MNREKVLKSLFTQVEKHLNEKDILNYSLLGEDFGCIIFLYFYSKRYKLPLDIADTYLERLLCGHLKYNSLTTYCNGLAGLATGLSILNSNKLIECSDTVLGTIDMRIKENLNTLTADINFDFLHGLIGVGFYLLRRKTVLSNCILEEIIDLLSCNIQRVGDRCFLLYKNQLNNRTFNISFAHGAASLILFLMKLNKLDWGKKRNEEISKMLHGAIKYLLSEKIDNKVYGSCFPTFPREDGYAINGSRLAWCYGDLGISMALKSVAKNIQNKELYDVAIEILKYNAQRRTIKNTCIYDAELCHGAAGVAWIFKQAYEDTKMDIFNEAFVYWDAIVMKMVKNYGEDYSFYSFNTENNSWSVKYGILDGISGIGLYLMGEYKILSELLLMKY